MNTTTSEEPPTSELPSFLRTAYLIVVSLGSIGAVGLCIRAGQNSPRFLLVMFVIWVLLPFAALVWANRISAYWSLPLRITLNIAMLVVTVGTLVIYWDNSIAHRRPQAAFVYVIIPPVSLLLIIIIALTATLISRRNSRRQNSFH